MRNWSMSLLVEVGMAGRFEMFVGEYDSYCAYNVTLDPARTRAVLPWSAHVQCQRLKDATALTAQQHNKNGQVRATRLRGHDVAPKRMSDVHLDPPRLRISKVQGFGP